jgi:heptosyltransferase-2
MTESVKYFPDCRHFKGYIPCKPHKEKGYHCENCPDYSPADKKILIIKLGATGDVIRTTPLITRIKKEHPLAEIWWLTYSPEIVPSVVDHILNFNLQNILTLRNIRFDIVINLDKDYEACALANSIDRAQLFGYVLKDGRPAPADDNAVHKFITGLFDDVSKANTKSYMEEIFEICGWEYEGEEYLLDVDKSIKWNIPNEGKKIIGLNTGCGARWVSRLWDNKNWIELIGLLNAGGYFPMLLGGKQEDQNNSYLTDKTGAYYPGYFSFEEFISLMDQCHGIVSAVTMGMHIAIGLKKPLILMNNIFNPNEFELFGRGEIVQPENECKCYFSPKCKNDEYFCMDSLKPETIYNAIAKHVG